MSTTARAKRLRKVLMDRVKPHLGQNIAIPMSSGVDSHCALFAALESGQTPTIFSFRLDDRVSRDFRIAEETARHFDLDFVEVLLPSSTERLVSDVIKLAKYNCVKKTDFECFWPMTYLIQAMRKKNMDVFFTGHGADSLYCMSRKAHQHFNGRFDEFRESSFSAKTAFQQVFIRRLAEKQFGMTYCPIFYCDEVLRIFLGATHEEMHHPIQKAISRFAFKDLFAEVKVYTHQSFQLGDSGISKHFDQLLHSSLNTGNYKSVIGIFNTLRRTYGK